MKKNKLTIVTVCLNSLNGLKKTIESIREQTWTEFELIIMDGCSTDGSIEYLNCMKHTFSNFKLFSKPDNGIYDAMNCAVTVATSDWIIFMNAGDVFYSPDVLLNTFSYFEDDHDLIFGDVMLGGGVLKKQKTSFLYSLRHSICHQSMFLSKVFLLDNIYDYKNYPITADNSILILKSNKLRVKKIDVIVCKFDMSGVSSMISNKSKIWNEKTLAYKSSDLTSIKIFVALVFCKIMFLLNSCRKS